MSNDATEAQGGPERRRSREISLQRERPPLDVPGYNPEKYLGMGAYGEVWVAVERNTGRQVAIKFYTHRGGLDWSLLSREVEKLAFLFADRYVVQLLGVGWNAEPPYYIMEYIEHGSLADRLQQGPLPVAEAVDLFRHVAIGLAHAHGKGVLHCDLKPANLLLDQDGKPRLADFGQSRLSDDQTPALGTLFYMAPEQANLTEAPNASWDVYALGAVLYCMLTGKPPHWSAEAVQELEATNDLNKRLALYRRMIRRAPPASDHRKVRRVDRQLAEIIDRCLAPNPENRYPNVQAVLSALDARDKRRSRRPVMLLGAIGPALLLLVVTWFAWQGFGAAISNTNRVLAGRALLSNKFLADNLAKLTGYELDRRIRAVRISANSSTLREALAKATGPDSELAPLLDKLADPTLPPDELEALQREFREDNGQRAELQKIFTARVTRYPISETAGWFLNDARGNQVAREPQDPIIGRNFAWRSYFSGLPDDQNRSWRPGPDQHITEPHLSAVYRSQATNRWLVAISAPIYDQTPEKHFLGIVSVMVELGKFIQFEGENADQFAALIDWRKGRNRGLVLQHPELEALLESRNEISESELRFKVKELRELPNDPGRVSGYVDPLSKQPPSRQQWLAQMAPVTVGDDPIEPDDCLVIVVQEDYQKSIVSTLDRLRRRLVHCGAIALAVIVILMVGLWALAIRMFRDEMAGPLRATAEPLAGDSTPSNVTPSATPTEPAES
ncbi:MAG: serine/threonine protein kinase [Pirellulales bacterium]|nr:serine/threonine protein kinase [Pirellulales bacterium]